METTRNACRGVTAVFHIAGLVSFGTFPDTKGMEDINVTGIVRLYHALSCTTQKYTAETHFNKVDVKSILINLI